MTRRQRNAQTGLPSHKFLIGIAAVATRPRKKIAKVTEDNSGIYFETPEESVLVAEPEPRTTVRHERRLPVRAHRRNVQR